MVFLAENVRPPVIGECLWNSETDESNLIPTVIPVMRKQKGFPFRYSAVTRSIETPHLAELPALLIKGEGSFNPDLFEKSTLEEYMKSGGLVLFEAMADREGMSFLNEAKQTVKTLLPKNSTLEDIGKDKDLMGTLAGKVQIQAFKRENGSLAAAFLPVLTNSGPEGLPKSIAARALYNMMLQKISPEILEDSYPSSISSNETSVEAE